MAHLKTHLCFQISLAQRFSRKLKDGKSRGPHLLFYVDCMNCCAKEKLVCNFVCVHVLLLILSWELFVKFNNLFI